MAEMVQKGEVAWLDRDEGGKPGAQQKALSEERLKEREEGLATQAQPQYSAAAANQEQQLAAQQQQLRAQQQRGGVPAAAMQQGMQVRRILCPNAVTP